ncbi:hypothetical protein EJ05DRAFT_489931 [Pseudovirgaria hyperparasitica]|uniref:Zn(2)-C6 fungal-type domain-containing protein n=1 Tax=Pseudovirgaria hyperparasitica TaxID=470096 RepID=A0A6A6VT53_9PEZI|nr:uncharacterized protein EJ05DRAFT_489931 [Pseudovirgaria hyperparasitica]KAF2753762.1 hypothetical protein EJ05DRAFT_489931 [Pseudovirgaria hyperparasitica]
MVYTGKPSRACQMCKSRRIKCDEERPSCGQCLKSARNCPGYPDEFDLIFRNENVALARRAQRSSTSKNSYSSNKSSPTSTSPTLQRSPASYHGESSSASSLTPGSEPEELFPIARQELSMTADLLTPTILPSLNPSTQTQATSFFFHNFVHLPREAESVRGFLEYLGPVYLKAGTRSPLQDATHAVALSAFGRYPERNDVLRQARVIYGQALHKVNEALRDPVKAKSDETLLSILLFSLYEVSVESNIVYARSAALAAGFGQASRARSFILSGIASTGLSNSARLTQEQEIVSTSELETQNWNHHVDGAVALVKMRGTEQFNNPQSYNIFRAVRSMMLTNCVQRKKPVDTFPGENGWKGKDTEENAANRLTMISMELPEIRSRFETLQSGQASGDVSTEVNALLQSTKKMDAGLENWAATLPSTWNPQIISIVEDSDTDIMLCPEWPGPQHIYNDVFVSNIQNDYRVTRIFCQIVIMGCLSIIGDMGQNSDFEMLRAQYTSQQMVNDICSSVPFHMSFDMHSRPRTTGDENKAAEALGAYFLAWPLFVCNRVPNVSEQQRMWIAGRLMRIGVSFGLDAAQLESIARRGAKMSINPSQIG